MARGMFAAEAQQKKPVMKRVPKGTSDYQAAWIIDSEEDEDEDDDDDVSATHNIPPRSSDLTVLVSVEEYSNLH